MRILFVTSNRLGDAVLSTGLLDHLIRAHPDARITVACGPVAEGVFARMPNRERTIVLDKLPYRRHWLPLWATTVGTLWDLVVDIRGSTIAWIVPTRRRAVMRRRPGHKIAQLAAVLGLDPPPLPVAWTARRGPCPRRRAAARGEAGHRAGSDGELAAKGLARRALRRAVPWPGARAAARRRTSRVRRSRRDGTRDGGTAAGRPARRDRPCWPAQPAGSRRLPRPMRAVRRQRFRPDAPCRGSRRADARPVRPDTGARNTRLPASVPPRCYRPAR